MVRTLASGSLGDLLSSRNGRRVVFFLLYLTEGVPMGFSSTPVIAEMTRAGLTPAQTGTFLGTLYLPWVFKFGMGPFIDLIRWPRLGPRRGWILITQLLMVAGLMALTPIDFIHHLSFFTAALFVVNLLAATQDVAIDALACSVLPEEERGTANGLMFAGAYLGQALGGSGVLFLSGHVPFKFSYTLAALPILAVTLGVVLPMREPVVPQLTPGHRRSQLLDHLRDYVVEAFKALFGSWVAVAGFVLALLPSGAYALSLALSTHLSVELGMDNQTIALITLLTTLVSAGACVVGGYISDRFGRRRMLALYVFMTGIPTLFLAWQMHRYGWIMPGSKAAPVSGLIRSFWAASLVYALFQGLYYGTRTALFMDVCTPAVAATQFSAYMALMNVVIWYTSKWQGYAAEAWGYPRTLLVDTIVGMFCIGVLPFMRMRPATRAARDEGLSAVSNADADV